MSTSHSLEALNDHALLSQFGVLVRQDDEGNANLLHHIDAIDRRQLWAELGYPSMFAFLVTRYHMSESTAGKRIGAARTARRFRSLFNMVARGEMHLSGIHRLKAHLTQENHEQVLAAAKHKPRAQKPKPRATTTTAPRRTRYLELAVRREVWTRDDGRCGFVGEDGHRCNETRGLQFAHVHPWAKDGANINVNLGLRCQAHNAWEADRDYGASHMASKRKRKPWKVQEPVARYNLRRVPCAMTDTFARSNGSAYRSRYSRQHRKALETEAWPLLGHPSLTSEPGGVGAPRELS